MDFTREQSDTHLEAAWKEIAHRSIDAKFTSLLQEISNLHEKKGRDYGTELDPLANCRASAELGIPPWKGVAIRRADKWMRQKQYLSTGQLSNESFEDSLLDDAVYALIELILWREFFGVEDEISEETEEIRGKFLWEKDE